MLQNLVGMWALRRAFRLLTADDPRPLRARLTREARQILVAAAVLAALLLLGVIVLIVLLIALVT